MYSVLVYQAREDGGRGEGEEAPPLWTQFINKVLGVHFLKKAALTNSLNPLAPKF